MRRRLEGAAGAAQFGVGGQGRQRMSGHLDLRHDGDVPGRRIGHNRADLGLGVKTGMGHAVMLAGKTARGARPPRAHLRQPGVALDFDAPALVFGQMPMQHVHFLQRQQVQHAQNAGLALEMPPFVEHVPAPAKARPVRNLHAGDLPFFFWKKRPFFRFDGQQLAQGLDSVEHAFFSGR